MKKVFLSAVVFSICVFGAVFGAVVLSTDKGLTLSAESTTQDKPVYSETGGLVEYYQTADGKYLKREYVGETVVESPLGYHLFPRAVMVIDESRYVVVDIVGIKIMDSKTHTPIGNQYPLPNRLVTKTYTDGWRNLYYSLIGGDILRLHVTANGTMEIDTSISEIPTYVAQKPLYDVTGALFDTQNVPSDIRDTKARWSLERVSGKVFYISDHDILTHTIDGYPNISNFEHYDWTTHRYEKGAEIFMTTKRDDTIISQYPNQIKPIAYLQKGTRVMVIKTVGNSAYVLHPTHGATYIDTTDLESIKFAKTDTELAQSFAPENKLFSVRTLVNNLPIYPYPTAVYTHTNADMVIGTLPRNYNLPDNAVDGGLQILREIIFPDADGQYYYEIEYGETVGYIKVILVIDSYEQLSTARFSSNARVKLPKDIGALPVLYLARDGELHENPNEMLKNGDRIQVVAKHDGQYTQILFPGFEDEPRVGYILTKYIQRDGISAWQIVAICALVVSLSAVVVIAIQFIRSRSRSKRL